MSLRSLLSLIVTGCKGGPDADLRGINSKSLISATLPRPGVLATHSSRWPPWSRYQLHFPHCEWTSCETNRKSAHSHTSDAVLRAMRRGTVTDNHATTGRFTGCGLTSCAGAASDLLCATTCEPMRTILYSSWTSRCQIRYQICELGYQVYIPHHGRLYGVKHYSLPFS